MAVRPSCTQARICSAIGMYTSCRAASSHTIGADFTPSATWFISAWISSSDRPLTELLADMTVAALRAHAGGEEITHPGEPGEGRRLAAERNPEAGQLGQPMVITAARVLSPVSSPSAIPAASAITFLRAPPSSQPMTSVLV